MSVFCGKMKERTKEMKKRSTLIAAAALVVVCVLAAILSAKFKPETIQGEKEVTVVVVHGDGSEKEFTYQTDAEYLAQILLENELVEGEEGEYGLYILSADGEIADESKQQWWCITKGGEQVNTSASEAPVADGDQYELTMKEGW